MRRLVLWLAVLMAGPVIAASVTLDDQQSFYQLGTAAEFLVDPDWTLTLDDVLTKPHQEQFRPVQEVVPNFGFSKSAYWLRVPIINHSTRRDWLFEIGWPHVDFIDLYWQTD